MSGLRFFVPGLPVTQGSMRSFAHPNTGKIVTLPDKPALVPWRHTVAAAAHVAGARPTDAAVYLWLSFRLPRPRSHAGKRGLRGSAPHFPISQRCGDIDKLERAVLDALTGVAWHDDGQVVQVAKRKTYATEDDPPGVEIVIRLIEDTGAALEEIAA